MNDDIYEQSAQQAVNVARNAKLDRTERPAQEAGFQARGIQDGDMDASWRQRGGGSNMGAPGDVQAKEMRENRRVVEARRAVLDTGGLSMDDLISVGLTDRDETARTEARQVRDKMARVAQFTGQNTRQAPSQHGLMEQNYQEASDGWSVVQKTATLNTGKVIPVFVVEDGLSGMSTGKKYRLAEVAEKVARVLNATNNMDDARIKMIDQTYDQHVKLMRERAEARKTGNTKALALIESKLAGVNARLGLD